MAQAPEIIHACPATMTLWSGEPGISVPELVRCESMPGHEKHDGYELHTGTGIDWEECPCGDIQCDSTCSIALEEYHARRQAQASSYLD